MKALILSDNHCKNIAIEANKYDYIFHAGDYGASLNTLKALKAIYVRGNCDIEGLAERVLEIDGIKIFITHGNLYNVKMDYLRLIYKAMSVDAKICIFGHTHSQELFFENGICFINPGAYKDNKYAEIIDDEIIFHDNARVIKKSLR